VYNLLNHIGVEDTEENLEADDNEYNYAEPSQLEPDKEQPEPPVLYDTSQKKEDKEIAHIEKRMAEKRVNAAPVAMHHKEYATRNKGKVLVYGAYRERPHHKVLLFPLKNSGEEYGYVTKILGGLRFLVYCYSNSREKLCRLAGKLRHSRTYVSLGEVVLIRIRSYQNSKADIIYNYSEEEYQTLIAEGELIDRDPRKILPPEIWQKILSYLDPESIKCISVL